jgi:hypothetical protein
MPVWAVVLIVLLALALVAVTVTFGICFYRYYRKE